MLKRLGMGLLLASLPGGVWAQGTTYFDGQYAGELTLLKTISGDCTKPPLGARYPLNVSAGAVSFKYVPRFDTRLTGAVNADGNFKASARVRSGTIQMTGRINGNDVTATIVSPSCLYRFEVKG